LYQNTLYDRLSASRRIQLHRRIAERGEDVYGERAREIAAELAMHFEQGSNHKRAIKYLQQAADNGIRRFAYKEAVGLARRGLDLLERLPESPERAEQELCLQLTLGVPLAATKGYAAVEVGNAYLRSRQLCQQLGDTPDVSEALWGLWAFHTVRTEFGTARDIAEEFLGLGERLPYAEIAMRGHLMMGVTLLHLGEFPLALEHLDKAYSAYDHTLHHEDALLYGQNPVVAIRCHASWALWFLGVADLALERIQEALKLARELSEPHGLAHTLYFAANLHQLRREARLAQEYADAAIAVSREHGLALYEAMATVTRGWSLIEQGRVKDGIEEMRHGLAAHQATGAIVGRPHYLALLSEALGRNAQAEEGLRLINEALELATKNGETRSPYLAEIYRIKGELLLIRAASRNLSRAATAGKELVAPDPPEVAEAESCFIQSIQIAQQQNAKSLALCGAMSLVRISQQYGKQEQARGLLKEILDTFTEGFTIADLREAKSLAELS
jgi:predicted ATPase